MAKKEEFVILLYLDESTENQKYSLNWNKRNKLSSPNQIKKELLQQLQSLVNDKITTAQAMIAIAKESKNNETKSTAGDKYETGRAMMQAEQEKSEVRLGEAQRLNTILSTIDISTITSSVQLGSLVTTDRGNYFVSIGLGKLKVNGTTYYSLSPAAPIGKLLMGKSVDDTFVYNNIEQTLLEIC